MFISLLSHRTEGLCLQNQMMGTANITAYRLNLIHHNALTIHLFGSKHNERLNTGLY